MNTDVEEQISPTLERRKYLRRESDRKVAEYVRRFYKETGPVPDLPSPPPPAAWTNSNQPVYETQPQWLHPLVIAISVSLLVLLVQFVLWLRLG